MEQLGVLAVMVKKPKGRGRPKASKPLKSIVSLKGTEDLETYLGELTEHVGSGSKAHTLRRGIKALADATGFEKPMPKR